MTDLRKAAEMALEALEDAETNNDGEARWDLHRAATEALRTALAQGEQELIGDEWTPCVKLPLVVHVRKQRKNETHVSTREGITPVKPDDLIMRGVAGEEYPIGRELFERTYTLYTAPPSKQEPEVVAVIGNWGRVEWVDGVYPQIGDRMYSAPPSKPWVSLTDREIEKAIVSTAPSFKPDDVAQAIEAALRSKNNG